MHRPCGSRDVQTLRRQLYTNRERLLDGEGTVRPVRWTISAVVVPHLRCNAVQNLLICQPFTVNGKYVRWLTLHACLLNGKHSGLIDSIVIYAGFESGYD